MRLSMGYQNQYPLYLSGFLPFPIDTAADIDTKLKLPIYEVMNLM